MNETATIQTNTKPTKWVESIFKKNRIKLLESPKTIYEQPGGLVQLLTTDCGVYFLKGGAPSSVYEPAVTQWLANHFPNQSVSVLAIEPEQGWLLMADGGQTLRQSFKTQPDLNSWKKVLADHGRLQLETADYTQDLLDFGTPDHRLVHLPNLYTNLLADSGWLLIDQENGVTVAEYDQLVGAITSIKEICTELTNFGIPESIHHNDLHDGNIFLNAGHLRYFDWGDCAVAHPFFVCRTAFVSIKGRFRLEEDDPVFKELGIDYTKTWQRYASAENLLGAFRLARKLWSISTALKYKSYLGQSAALRKKRKGVLPAIMKEFLDENR
ncbi:MAG: hypothetical protein ACI9EW_003333 [Cellvibrionaceae bacterium]|jgi:hypothetical protein